MVVPVLLMARELDLGGSERQMTQIARSLDRTQFQPHIGCFKAAGMRGDELRDANIPVAEFKVHSYKSASAITGGRDLVRYIRDHDIQLVHTFDYPLNVFALPIVRVLTRAAVVSSQRAHRNLTPGVYLWLQRLTDRFVDGIVVNCMFLRAHLVADYGFPAKSVYVCYNGIDLAEFQPQGKTARNAFPPESMVIGVVSALRPEKGLLTLVEAFARIRRLRRNLKLAIVGSGPMLEALRSRAQELSITADCLFQPATIEVAAWLRAIDIFVLPSHSEGLSNSLMEAMACGCCCVASEVGGNPELIGANARGLLFRAEDTGDLAGALQRLVSNADLRRTLAQQASQFLHARFSLASSAECMGEIYHRLLANRG